MRERFGREPNINRQALALWMPLSLAVAALLLWLGMQTPPPDGAASVQSIPTSSEIGALAYTYLLSWAAFGYAASISTPHDTMTRNLFALTLVLPVSATAALNHDLPITALLAALGWLIVLAVTALRLGKREPLAGLMLLPLIGSAGAGILLPVIYWAIR
ncbi:hypothetical protein A9404_03570 [Halothiobacillus diazotrophicus]|uniref:Yip1 domain-containing protein n=1 Tax=Halothiobacillus diazotrophicus TaxID=1860122 RepID=A0A191ZFC7_9GAMM|nr:hypothetical protein [Halothiobacillus diazotrophicus]ANJ66581.1 hypothetical protein A9404_03570 [Halothiobacillus diazotrophicus]